MDVTRNSVVKKETEARLKAHGLTLTIDQDLMAKKPFKDSSIVFVGGDSYQDYFTEHFKGDMTVFVRAFCKKVLGCRADVLIWKTVYSKNPWDHNYAIVSEEKDILMSGHKEHGFVYMTKEQIKKDFKVNGVGASLKKEIIKDFEYKIAYMNAWRTNSIYRVSLMTGEGGYYETWDGVFEDNESIDVKINSFIDSLVESIDTDIDGCRFELTFSINEMRLPIDCSPTEHLINHVKNKYGFIPCFGAIDHNRRDDILKTNMLANVMPPFDELADKDMFDCMQANVKKAMSDEQFTAMSEPSVLEALNSAEHYTEWTPLMIHALMLTITEGVEGVKLTSAQIADSCGGKA